MEPNAITERTASTYLHMLGADYRSLKRGTFSNKHEDFAEDRVKRFLPMESDFFRRGPSWWQDAAGDWHSTDKIDDMSALSGPKFVYNILGGDGVVRKINLGDMLHPDHQGKYILFYVHDESCFDAGEQQTKGWLMNGQRVCMDKGRGPKRHLSSRICRYGNGTLDSDPDEDVG